MLSSLGISRLGTREPRTGLREEQERNREQDNNQQVREQ
jgi:hypothetical protein